MRSKKMTDPNMDGVVYTLEDLRETVEDVIILDRGYFLERKGELIQMLEDFIERLEDE